MYTKRSRFHFQQVLKSEVKARGRERIKATAVAKERTKGKALAKGSLKGMRCSTRLLHNSQASTRRVALGSLGSSEFYRSQVCVVQQHLFRDVLLLFSSCVKQSFRHIKK